MTYVAVLIAGSVGLALVARAALVYRGVDGLAFALVLLIGALLVLGIAELFVRARRSSRLLAEVRALPASASPSVLDAASSEVRASLQARIAGIPIPAAPALFSSYLLGLLVMIGLLGTFLGLFETLRGAREALTASTDVAALRVGLAAPMQGLSRAFGSSAAGVAASAMLGVALVFVRRADAHLARAFAAYSAGPLSPMTIAGRTLAALELLAAQGREHAEAAATVLQQAITPRLDAAVARAGEAIDAHVQRWEARSDASSARTRDTLLEAHRAHDARLAALATSLSTLNDTATQNLGLARDASTALHETATSVRDDLGKTAGETAAATAAALEGAITPRLDAAVARAGAAIDEHVERWEKRTETTSAQTRSALLDAHRAEVAALRTAIEGDAARIMTTMNHVVEIAAGGFATRAAQDAGHDARLTSLAESLASLVATVEARTAASETRLAALEGKLATTYEASSELLTERLTTHAQTLEDGVTQNLALVREAADVLRDGGEDLTSVAQLFAGAVDRYREASDRWLSGLTALRTAAEQAARGDAQDLIGAYLDQTREVFDHSMQFQRQLFVELRQLASKGS